MINESDALPILYALRDRMLQKREAGDAGWDDLDPSLVEVTAEGAHRFNSGNGAVGGHVLRYNCPVHGSDQQNAAIWVNDEGTLNSRGHTCDNCTFKLFRLLDLEHPWDAQQVIGATPVPREQAAKADTPFDPFAAITDTRAFIAAAKAKATELAGERNLAHITIAYTPDGRHCQGEIRWNYETGAIRLNERGGIVPVTAKKFVSFTNGLNNTINAAGVPNDVKGHMVVVPAEPVIFTRLSRDGGSGPEQHAETFLAKLSGADDDNHIVVESELPELVKHHRRVGATGDQRTAVVVEGPKVAALLRHCLPSQHYDVICSLMGSSNAKAVDWSQLIRYEKVVICPDVDAPGDKFAHEVFSSLTDTGFTRVEVIDWWQFPGIKNAGDDLFDIIREILTDPVTFAKQLEARRAVDNAAGTRRDGEDFGLLTRFAWGADERDAVEQRVHQVNCCVEYIIENAARQNVARFRSLSTVEPLLAKPAVPDASSRLVPGLIHQGHRTYLFGTKKTGKTTTLYRLMLDVAAGQPVFGIEKHTPLRPLSVLYIYGEGTEDEHRVRLSNLAAGEPDRYHDENGTIRRDIVDRIFIHNARLKLDDRSFLADLTKAAYTKQFDLVIIDPSYRCLSYDQSQLNSYGKMIGKLQDAFGRSTLLISHHMKKGTEHGRFTWCPSVNKVVGTGMPEDSGCDIMLFAPKGNHDGPSPVRMEISGRICNATIDQYLYRFDPNECRYTVDFITRADAEAKGLSMPDGNEVGPETQAAIDDLNRRAKVVMDGLWDEGEAPYREDLPEDVAACIDLMPQAMRFTDTDQTLERVSQSRRPDKALSQAARHVVLESLRDTDQGHLATHNENDEQTEYDFTGDIEA